MSKLREKLRQLAKDIDIPTASLEQVIGTVENHFDNSVVMPVEVLRYMGYLLEDCPDVLATYPETSKYEATVVNLKKVVSKMLKGVDSDGR